jgi:hypothetical protein
VRDRSKAADLPSFEAGLRQLRLVEAVLASSKKGAWVTLS